MPSVLNVSIGSVYGMCVREQYSLLFGCSSQRPQTKLSSAVYPKWRWSTLPARSDQPRYWVTHTGPV